MSIIPQSSGKSFFPHFCENLPHFTFISEKTKFPKNCDNFQRPEYILWTEALRKRPKRAPAMFSTWKSDCESSTLRQKNFYFFLCTRQSTSAKTKIKLSVAHFLPPMLTPMVLFFCKWCCIFECISLYVVVGNNKFTTTTTTTSVGYGLMRLSPRLLSGSILRNPLPEASRNHYCPLGGERNHAMWLRRGRLGHQLRQMQSGMKTSMMAMHDNVHLLLVKLRLKADICHMWHGTC